MTEDKKKPIVHYRYYNGGNSAEEKMKYDVWAEQRALQVDKCDDYYMSRGSLDKLCCPEKPTHPFAIVELDYGKIHPDKLLAIFNEPHYQQIWVIAKRSIADVYEDSSPDMIKQLRNCCDVHEKFEAMVVRTHT